MVDPKRIRPPAPIEKPDRLVAIPATIGEVDPFPKLGSLQKAKTRADFRAIEFQRVIEQHGKTVVWRKAMLCACHNETTGQAEVNCFDCEGSGYVYVDPVEIQASMLGFDRNPKIYERFGLWLDGSSSITVLPQHRLHHWDSIEMLDSIMSFGELIKKNNRRGRRSKLPDGVDSARYRIINLTKLMFKAEGGGFVSLELGYHFEIEDNGWIKWREPGNRTVEDGTFLSVLYDFHPIWIVISHPHALRDDRSGRTPEGKGAVPDQVNALPIQALCRLDYLLTDANSAKTLANP